MKQKDIMPNAGGFTALAVTIASLTVCAVEPIAYWNMESVNSDGTVSDASGNGRSLTLQGDASVMDGELDGKALFFDPTAATARAIFSCPALGNRTVSMWLRWDAGDGGDDGVPYLFSQISGMRVHGVASGTNPLNKGALYIGGSSAQNLGWHIMRGVWMHVALVIDDVDEDAGTATIRFYQNGTQRASLSGVDIGAAKDWKKASNAFIGNQNAASLRSFHGFMDEIKVFDAALTAKEVWDEYSRLQSPADVAAHWKCDRLDANGWIPDDSGNAPLNPVSGVTLVDDEFRGKALFFDGMNKTYASAAVSNLMPRFTFAAWLKVPTDRNAAEVDPSNENKFPRIFQTSAGNPRIQFYSDTNDLRIITYYAGEADNAHCQNGFAAKGLWTHFAVTYDVTCDSSGNYTAHPVWYVNGELKASGGDKALTLSVEDFGRTQFGISPYNTLQIGGTNGNRPFYGYMSDIWILGRVATADEIRQMAKGVAKVSAGEDFTVHGATALLTGTRNPDAAEYPVRNAAGVASWSVVSVPSGVDASAVVFGNKNALVTEVTLPAAGDYVFRLTNAGSFGIEEIDEVMVSRASGAASAPTLSAMALVSTVEMPAPVWLKATASEGARLLWRKKSGPGGVYFSDATSASAEAIFTAPGNYVLSCTAVNDDAETHVDVPITVTGGGTCAIDDGDMTHYWNFDQGPWEKSTRTSGTWFGGYALKLSKVGFGLGDTADSVGTAAYYDTGAKLDAAKKTTIAWWMYHDDPAAANSALQYGRIFWENSVVLQYQSQNATPTIIVYETNASSPGGGYKFTSSGFTASNLRKGAVKGRWAHVAVTMDFSDYSGAELPPSSRVKFYVDGQEITTASVAVDGNPTDATGNYVLNLVARNNNNARWGGISTVNRYFPGVLDEMRYYTNVLSQAQIARLAFEFSPENRAPIVEVPTETVRVSAGKALALQGAVFDDGNGTPACAWDVVEGDKSLVVFDDETNPLSGVVFRKAGKYTLVLRASDGELATVSDPVAVDILPRGSVVSFR